MTSPKFRALQFGVTQVALREGAPGVRYLAAPQPLEPHPERMSDRLLHWAQSAPERIFMGRRERLADGATGDWQTLTYAQAWAQLQATSRRYPDREDHERLPIGAKGFDSLEELVTRLTHSARDDVHALTLADAICTLWHNFPSPDVRVRLAAIGAHFAKLPAPPPA